MYPMEKVPGVGLGGFLSLIPPFTPGCLPLGSIPSPAAFYLTIFMELGSYSLSFTPMTNVGASGEGALMTTLWAPPLRCS